MADIPPIFPASDAQAREGLRRVLHQAADAVVDYLCDVEERPIFPLDAQAPAGELIPDDGQELGPALTEVTAWAADNAVHVHHPGYFGHMDSGVAVAGIVGDLLASTLNQNLLAFELAPGATLLEQKLVRSFARLAGLPESAGGIFTTGGTTANLTALLQARDGFMRNASRDGLAGQDRACILCSADAHYSIAKAAAVIGLGSDQVLKVPVAGPERRLDAAQLPHVYRDAVTAGLQPIALVATAGTTSCGAIDPLTACADFCAESGLWLHVDGAHGGALLLHPQESHRLNGIQRADSVSLDPHKWLFLPKSTGILLLRNGEDWVTAQYQAPYLDRFTSHGEALPVSQGRRALDGSRRFDALKLWLVLRHLGRNGIARLLDERLALIRWFHQELAAHPVFAPCHTPDLNVQAFAPRDPAWTSAIAAAHRAVEAEGQLWSSYTRIQGDPVHRVVSINPSGTREHLSRLLASLEIAHRSLVSTVAPEERHC